MQLRCEECARASEQDARGWRVYCVDDPEVAHEGEDLDDGPTLAAYCPRCAEREFGVVPRRTTR